ncbi:MBL fold metallo-hydrolase [soil metagenome]
MMTIQRRSLLKAAAAGAGAAGLGGGRAAVAQGNPGARQAWAEGTKLLLLGTMAGPVLNATRAMSSQIVFVDGHGYLIDCGYGAIGRMTEAGIRLPQIEQVFLTHHHSDHTADYPAFLNLAWIIGIPGQIGVFGPPPLARMHAAALAVFEEDTEIRVRATGRKPIAQSYAVKELRAPGVVFQDERVKISAALADHAPFDVAFGFRFDTPARSIVISGDTSYSEHIVALAEGADVLVHEAMLVPAIDKMLAARPYVPPRLREFLLNGHTSAQDAGRVAAKAGVKTLVLSHLLPGDTAIDDSIWIAEAARHFKGQIVVGRDRLVV